MNNDTKRIHIAIDFEYHTIQATEAIDHLYCVTLHSETGAERRYWLSDGRDTQKFLKDINRMKRGSGYVLVCHAMELAEARCFWFMGLNPTEWDWRDTWIEAQMLLKSFFIHEPESCSLAECLARFCGIQIDVGVKKECRMYCITGAVEGHEADILEYNASDTRYLIDLAVQTLSKLAELIGNSGSIHRKCEFSEDTLIETAYMVNCSSEIARRGIPMDVEACEAVKMKVPDMLMQLSREFNDRYPGTFMFSTLKGKAKATRKLGAVYKYLREFLESVGALKDWTLTKAGEPSTNSKLLKQFKDQDNFAGNYLDFGKTVTSVRGLAKDNGESWLSNLADDGRIYYQSLRALTASTGRFQPQPSKGFVFGWAHFLYVLMNPRPGKWLVEIDYHAQETALQAVICDDPKYAEVYDARDTYLWMAWQLGLITREQYEEMPGQDSAWKLKYEKVRKPIKTFTLAWSYGGGYRHLARLVGISEGKSKSWVENLNFKVFRNAYRWKQRIVQMTDPTHGKLHGLCFPDGFVSRSIRYKGEECKSDTVKMNFPFQGFGAFLMREIVKKCHEQKLPAIATIHDAVMFEVDEGDTDTVNRCLEVMEGTAREWLGSDLLKCGSPVYWKHHSLSDIVDADLRNPKEMGIPKDDERYPEAYRRYIDNVRKFQDKVGDLVEIEDVKKFQSLLAK